MEQLEEHCTKQGEQEQNRGRNDFRYQQELKRIEGNQNSLIDKIHQTDVMRYEDQQEGRQYEEKQKFREEKHHEDPWFRGIKHQRRNKSNVWDFPKRTVGYSGRGHLLDSSPPNLRDELLLPRLSSTS